MAASPVATRHRQHKYVSHAQRKAVHASKRQRAAMPTGGPKKVYGRTIGTLRQVGPGQYQFAGFRQEISKKRNKPGALNARQGRYLMKAEHARQLSNIAGGANRKKYRAQQKSYAAKAGYRSAHLHGQAGYHTYRHIRVRRGAHGHFAGSY